MPDIASISAAFTGIKTATDLAKFIKGSELTLKDAEVKLKLAELIIALVDVKTELADIQTLLISKQEEINELNRQLKLKDDLTWNPPYYWIGSKEDGNGPYCQNCYDDKSKLIRLQGNNKGFWNCKTCDSDYYDSTYESPKPLVFKRRTRWDGL